MLVDRQSISIGCFGSGSIAVGVLFRILLCLLIVTLAALQESMHPMALYSSGLEGIFKLSVLMCSSCSGLPSFGIVITVWIYFPSSYPFPVSMYNFTKLGSHFIGMFSDLVC